MSLPLLGMMFSRSCEECGIALPDEAAASLCFECRESVRLIQSPFCTTCGDPVQGTIHGPYDCFNCRALRPAFDCARSAVHYMGPAKTCLRRFKYHQSTWLQNELVQWLAFLWKTFPPSIRKADFLISIPLYSRRERERGYNQAELLTQGLANAIGLPAHPRVLARLKPTATQTHLTAAQRLNNVKGVFGVSRPARVRTAKIILVDDVMTTGATANECARVLKEAGAASVMVVTVARGG